jgi:lactaldehyde dehydrogenase / glycolaldehyde dehydrogenase
MSATATQMFIDGQWCDALSGQTRPVIDPATEVELARVPEAEADDAAKAIDAASAAFRSWSRLPAAERGGYLRAIADGIRARADELARLVVAEQGKPISEAHGELEGTAGFFDYYSGLARTIQGDIVPSDLPGEEIWIRRVPHGVVVGIIPWNYPSALTARKVAPAIVAGNTIVLKPHEDTPLSALALMDVIREVGLPAGVVNVVTGAGAEVGAALVRDPRTTFVSMTGSVRAGRQILQDAAERVTPVSLELGGKAPLIVFDDADLDIAIPSAITSRYMNCGQVCICNERTYVHSSVYDDFVERYVEAVRELRVGDPTEATTDIGPKINRPELDKVSAMVDDAVGAGARTLIGGNVLQDGSFEKGFWYEPTVLVDVDHSMSILHDEIFGPVTPIMAFDDLDEVVDLANDSNYGLSAYLFTNDFQRVMRTVNDVRFGEVYVNRVGPEALQGFHVGYGQSGLGGDDGHHGLDLYLQRQTVYANFSGQAMDGLMPYGQ